MTFSVRLELRRLVFGSNCVILCSARIVSFSVRFRIVLFSVRLELCHLVFVLFHLVFELCHLVFVLCHLGFGSNCVI